MSVIEAPPADAVSYTLDDFWPLSIEQYHRMIREGILTEDDPVELLHGRLTRKMPKNPPRRISTQETRSVLERCLPSGWSVQVQEPITTEDSEPEPDITVIRGTARDYADRHPGPEDVALVVEVADATLARDQVLKRLMYAEAGVPVYWIVNLIARRLEVYEKPEGGDYTRRAWYGEAEEVPLLLGEAEIARLTVASLLP